MPFNPVERVLSVGRHVYGVSLLGQASRDEVCDPAFVLDKQNSHALSIADED